MNNKILFRGFHPDENSKTVITVKDEKIRGEWIYGNLVSLGEERYICYADERHSIQDIGALCIKVIPETIGQFVTTDKNGKDVFEGDIVKNNRGELMLIEWVQKYTRFTLTCKEKGIILATFVPEQCELISNKWECAE